MEYYRSFRISFLLFWMCLSTSYAHSSYTVLNANEYHETVFASRVKISALLNQLKSKRHLDADTQISFIAEQLTGLPYLDESAMGEGDWQPKAASYQGEAVHLRQHPVYRLDGLNCQTLVQVAMALYHSSTLTQFEKNYLKIAYGAAGNPGGEIVRFYNRNHFIEADFNPINQRNGWLKDVTAEGLLASFSKQMHATITRQNWFLNQHEIEVLDNASGPLMFTRYNTIYTKLNFPRFEHEEVVMNYLPKDLLVLREDDNSFKPNQQLLDHIPTPAIAEIVRDPKHWHHNGTEMMVSHLGLLYRKNFRKDEVIYQKTSCQWIDESRKVCEVTPVICQQNLCRELMFTHATNRNRKRVVSVPFYEYLTDYQSGYFTVMDVKSIVGVHVERL